MNLSYKHVCWCWQWLCIGSRDNSWFVVFFCDIVRNMRLSVGTMAARYRAVATPKFGLLLTKNVSDKSWDSSLQKLIPLSVSPLLLCRLKLSPHSQSRIFEISLGDWISNSSASEAIKFEKCSLSRQYSGSLFMMEYWEADKLIPHFCCSLFSSR